MLQVELKYRHYGVEYDGSTRASGARRLGSIPSTPTKQKGHPCCMSDLVIFTLSDEDSEDLADRL